MAGAPDEGSIQPTTATRTGPETPANRRCDYRRLRSRNAQLESADTAWSGCRLRRHILCGGVGGNAHGQPCPGDQRDRPADRNSRRPRRAVDLRCTPWRRLEMGSRVVTTSGVSTANAAVDRAAWAEACDLFVGADRTDTLSGDDLRALGDRGVSGGSRTERAPTPGPERSTPDSPRATRSGLCCVRSGWRSGCCNAASWPRVAVGSPGSRRGG